MSQKEHVMAGDAAWFIQIDDTVVVAINVGHEPNVDSPSLFESGGNCGT